MGNQARHMEYSTCEICGEESPNDGTGIWAAFTGVRVHRGLCFHEFGLLQNAPGEAFKASLEKFGDSWRATVRQRVAEERGRIRRELLEAVKRFTYVDDDGYRIMDEETFLTVLDRICPEEG